MDGLLRAVAHNVRATRVARGLSLAQLASRSGVAKSTLSQLESASANPTLGTLVALSEALGIPFEDLTASEERRTAVEVVRADEGESFNDDAVAARLVAGIDLPAAMGEFYHLRLRPESSETSAGHGPGAREYAFVVTGRVRLGPVGHEVELEASDYATYPADGPHAWVALGPGPADVWLLACYPRSPD